MMVEEQRKALLGLHDKGWASMVCDELSDKGYDVTSVDTLDGMLGAMGLSRTSPSDASPAAYFAWYVMDVNLGNPGAASCDAAARVYGHIKAQVERGTVHFMGISGKDAAVTVATQAGIPCMSKKNYVYGRLG